MARRLSGTTVTCQVSAGLQGLFGIQTLVFAKVGMRAAVWKLAQSSCSASVHALVRQKCRTWMKPEKVLGLMLGRAAATTTASARPAKARACSMVWQEATDDRCRHSRGADADLSGDPRIQSGDGVQVQDARPRALLSTMAVI